MTDISPRRRYRLARVGLIVLGILALIGLGSVVAVSRLEESDRFCAWCHMAPERTYYNRAQYAKAGAEPVLDLASAHYLANPSALPHEREFRCIDCHRGDESVIHRGMAITLGARDAAIYLFGTPDQTIEKTEIEVPGLLTDSCLKCHSDTLLNVGFPNHFHNKLPAAGRMWEQGGELTIPEGIPQEQIIFYEAARDAGLQIEETDLLCVDCHLAHINTPGSELQSFIDVQNIVYPACEECHIDAMGHSLGLTIEFESIPTEEP